MPADSVIALIVLISLIAAASCNIHNQAKKRREQEAKIKEKPWHR